MKFLPLSALTKYKKSRSLSPLLNPKIPNPNFFSSVAAMLPLTDQSPSENPDELLCAALPIVCSISDPKSSPTSSLPTVKSFDLEQNVKRAWRFWNNLGAPKLVVAPMVDNSELPFRMLCRKYGAQAAYTPMLHSKIFLGNEKHRKMEFSTCQEDRPLFVQFCANDPDTLLGAAKIVEPYCDYVDINIGCPQRIARRGNYGAFLMDNLPLVKSLVEKLSINLHVPVSCKIRIFPNLEDTISYAKMLEKAGCSLLAVHGRTRDEKDSKKFQADWNMIKEVKNAVRIPVLANGNIRHMGDVQDCLEHTGADGVLSAETLLENPALFAGFRTVEWKDSFVSTESNVELNRLDLVEEYLKLCEKYPVPWRMIRSHLHKMLGDTFKLHPEVREEFNRQSILTFEWLFDMVSRLRCLGGSVPLYGSQIPADSSIENVYVTACSSSC